MPTVFRSSGDLRVVIYPNDHRPAHVHVIGGGREAVFDLHCPEGPPELRESYGFLGHELAAVGRMLGDAITALCGSWRMIHGDP